MITADRQRRCAGRVNGSEEGGDFGERALQLEGPFDPGISQIGDADEVEGRHAGRLIDLADERRLVAKVARAVTRAWAVGDATVERHANETDVDLIGFMLCFAARYLLAAWRSGCAYVVP
jgi:hypothetical protein